MAVAVACAFGAVTLTSLASTVRLLNIAVAKVMIMAARRTVLPTLSLLIWLVLLFMVCLLGFGRWWVLRLLMSPMYGCAPSPSSGLR